VGEPTERDCAACGGHAKLHHRSIHPGLEVDECGRCAGLWLDNATFEQLVGRAEQLSTTLRGPTTGERRGPGPAAPMPAGPAYRPCPRCGKLMNRQNYARRSNVVIDVCREHGAWFDAHELGRILDWVRSGGLEQARAQELEQLREERRRRDGQARADALAPLSGSAEDGHADMLTAVLRWLG